MNPVMSLLDVPKCAKEPLTTLLLVDFEELLKNFFRIPGLENISEK